MFCRDSKIYCSKKFYSEFDLQMKMVQLLLEIFFDTL
jgi:hypothetical protein